MVGRCLDRGILSTAGVPAPVNTRVYLLSLALHERRTIAWISLCCWLAIASSLAAAEPALDLSEAERGWVAAHPVIRIQMSDCSPPFEFREDGVWKGLAFDYLVEAGRRLGMRIEPTGISWANALEHIQGPGAKDVDLLLAVTRGTEREQQMLLTRSYVAFPQVIFASKQHPFIAGLKDLASSRIAIEDEYVMQDWLKRDLPQAHFTVVRDTGACLVALSSGQVDAYVGNLAVASFLIEKLGLVNIEVVAPSGYGDEEFSMGVRKDWPELVVALDAAIASIPPEQQQAMRQRWLSVRYEHGLRTADIVKWVVIVALVALVFIVQLRRMVNRRTAELKREVELRRAQEAHLSEAQRIGGLGSWTRDMASGAITWSDETYRIFGWPPGQALTLERFLAVVHPDDLEALRAHQSRAATGQPFEAEYRIIRPDGALRHLLERCRCVTGADGRIVRLEGIALDITERKRAEDERARLERSMRHTEKLRLIGQLASGIAHDFNNQLAGITGYADLLKRAMANAPGYGEPQPRYVDSILLAAERAAAITAQLRIFSRSEELVRGPLDLHGLIRESVELATHGSGGAMAVELSLRAEPSTVLGDAAQIQTALVNLALNARDAMPGGGQLAISTRNVHLHAPIPGGHHVDFRPGPFIEAAIADAGTGMDDKVLAMLFEPFFTTKEVGKGTGLGLANVYSCMKNHGGAIVVESQPGVGSTFRLYFPAEFAEAAAQAAPPNAPVRGHGSILLVDDDATLRKVTSEMLEQLGYTVTTAAGGHEAADLVAARPGAFQLAIIDMIMPGLDGRESIALIRRHDPHMRIVICSGSFRNEPAYRIPEADAFLQKPFMLAPLSRLVAEMLGRADATRAGGTDHPDRA